VREALRREVEQYGDADYAEGAQRYMKSSMPYLGVRMPDLRRAWRVVFVSCPLRREAEFHDALRELKAIGWALRDLAWHDPRTVARYVRDHENELSPLSRREATKNLARLLA
jgi:3-methyladenine DNA glycosylase AlkD